MNLKDCRDAYKDLSGLASTVSRQLGFAGIAIVWLFRTNDGGGQTIPDELILPGLIIVLALSADFLQYISGALSWGIYGRYREIFRVGENNDFSAPNWINWPSNTFWFIKLTGIALAYYFIISFFIKKFVE